MNAWSALVLIVMTVVVGAVTYFTKEVNVLWALFLVLWMGDSMVRNRK